MARVWRSVPGSGSVSNIQSEVAAGSPLANEVAGAGGTWNQILESSLVRAASSSRTRFSGSADSRLATTTSGT